MTAETPSPILPATMRARFSWIISRITKRAPDLCIGGEQNPYMRRWYILPRNRFLNIYLHNIMRSDEDRALHDHPWWSLSRCLRGGMLEMSHGNLPRPIVAGEWRLRSATFAHRLIIDDSDCWTIFITGPRLRDWGFHCPNGWVHWRAFTEGPNGETVGKGCDQ